MTKSIIKTAFNFPGQKYLYSGKVRDVYNIEDQFLVMITTDRISAFDVILPRPIPYKGQVLNQIASMFLDATADIVPNWKLGTPDPMAMVGYRASPFRIEMVVRGCLSGHIWREYKEGKRSVCGVTMPDGMKEHQKFPRPVITPTTKALEGHDVDIPREEIFKRGLVPEEDYELMEKYSLELFSRGTEMAAQKGLILADTKYEFGKKEGKIYLIDEIHTPDSSRYFYSEGYEDRLASGSPQKQLSKEFVREWLISNGFQGKPGQIIPPMTKKVVESISERYIELFEKITGEKFRPAKDDDITARIEKNILGFLVKLKVT